MKHCIKQTINKQLCRIAKGIQVNSCSGRAWGEVKLPECLREELEETDKAVK
ncbi:MAG: hypothetical protein NC347_04505 [Clostridium sp.]|nr:hypothetical protein [Clostridium sp.]